MTNKPNTNHDEEGLNVNILVEVETEKKLTPQEGDELAKFLGLIEASIIVFSKIKLLKAAILYYKKKKQKNSIN